MILINGEEINLGYSKEPTPYEVVIKEKIKDIKESFKGRFPLRFSLHKNLITNGTISEANGRNAYTVPIYPHRPIKLSQSVIINDERVVLTYCKKLVYNKSKNEYRPDIKNLDLAKGGKLDVIEHDADLAFYLLYVHNNVDNAFDCLEIKRDVVPGNPREYFYTFVDEHKVAMETIQRDKAKVKTQAIIYAEMTDEIVKAMSIRYNIAGAEIKNVDMLRIELFNKIVSTAETAYAYENVYGEFESKYKEHLGLCNKKSASAKEENKEQTPPPTPPSNDNQNGGNDPESELDKELRLKSLITKAENAGIIRANGLKSTNSNYHFWCFVNSEGKNGDRICAIINRDAADSLYKALLINENDIVKNIESRVEAYDKAKGNI
jgi:hypothetical protein